MADPKHFDPEALNMSMRKFLKRLGVTSQQEIEAAIRAADASGALQKHQNAGGKLAVRAVITIDEIEMEHVVAGEISLSSSADEADQP